MISAGRGPWPGGRRLTAGAIALLSVFGGLGVFPSAVQASPSLGLNWTRQAPASSPPARSNAAIAYDAATGTVVLFGGFTRTASGTVTFGDTWTWDGSTWTKQSPASSPPARDSASMAYDAATGTVLLFGGISANGPFGDTWTWDGSTWTKQNPAAHPLARSNAAIAYDAATRNVVLFGGVGIAGGKVPFGDTWTWNGSTWTKRAPAAHPPGRYYAAMAYDAATSNIVLFGGVDGRGVAGDTWTWDGSTWTMQAPPVRSPNRSGASMAYDAATRNVVLFGGASGGGFALDSTWTWDGSTWKKQNPAAHPSARVSAAMAYDAATRNVVLFGGVGIAGDSVPFGDTWTWG